ncbi:MAG TPA: GNAT family N-acetyltransferase [Allosphingosinicella sp.]|jgi:RimJ/RimL family protein N-acetyltransferase
MIETERLTLRNWRPEDVVAFDTYTNTENVMRWLGGVRTREALEAVVQDRFIRWQERLGHTFWVVERKSDGAFLGFCGLKIADDGGSPVDGNVEVGWRFREDVWGQGYAKEAAAASLDFAFDIMGVRQVIALTVEGNAPSWGLMERLGMTRRPDLDYVGPEWAEGIVIVYVIRREEWRS